MTDYRIPQSTPHNTSSQTTNSAIEAGPARSEQSTAHSIIGSDASGHDPEPEYHDMTDTREELPRVAAMSIDHPRPHLLGWGEEVPTIDGRTQPCDICHALPGHPHLMVEMSIEETIRRLAASDTPTEMLDVEQLKQAADNIGIDIGHWFDDYENPPELRGFTERAGDEKWRAFAAEYNRLSSRNKETDHE